MMVTLVTPTIPPPGPKDLNSSLTRNNEALARRREKEAALATREQRIAQTMIQQDSCVHALIDALRCAAWAALGPSIVLAALTRVVLTGSLGAQPCPTSGTFCSIAACAN